MTSVGLPDPAVFRRVVRRLAGAKPPLRPPGPPEPAVPPRPHQVRLLLRTVKPLVALVRQVGAVLADDAVPDLYRPDGRPCCAKGKWSPFAGARAIQKKVIQCGLTASRSPTWW